VLLGVVAWVLLAATNGTDGIKMLSNLGGVPALFLTVLMAFSLVRVARNPSKYDVRKEDYDDQGKPIPSKAQKATNTEEVVFDDEPALVAGTSV